MSRDYVEFAKEFEKREIDAASFSHLDHVGVAHELLSRYGFLDAAVIYCKCINEIATRAGAAGKFNTTITLAFLSLIAERMDASSAATFDEFITANCDLLSRDVLAQRYSSGRLASDLARSAFLLPDRAA
ncbi:MAG: hypothetical protein AAF441_23250 [Pseudomonadota bacterium]